MSDHDEHDEDRAAALAVEVGLAPANGQLLAALVGLMGPQDAGRLLDALEHGLGRADFSRLVELHRAERALAPRGGNGPAVSAAREATSAELVRLRRLGVNCSVLAAELGVTPQAVATRARKYLRRHQLAPLPPLARALAPAGNTR